MIGRERATILLIDSRALGKDLHHILALVLGPATPAPTLADHLTAVAPTFSPATAATYGCYWRLAVELLGDQAMNEITVVDLHAVVAESARRAQRRRPGSSGRSSQETCIAGTAGAVRPCCGRRPPTGKSCRRDRKAPAGTEPPPGAVRHRAGRADRRYPNHESGPRPRLAAGPLSPRDRCSPTRCPQPPALRPRPDPTRSTVWLREKDGSDREQPLAPRLLTLLERHAHHRDARSPKDSVFRHRNGRPISARRYNTIFDRARTCLEWADRTPVSAHVLRHTAITAVGRLAGYPVAQAFAGHTPPSITGHYMQATIEEVATAISTLTNQPHPLAQPNGAGDSPGRRCHREQPRT